MVSNLQQPNIICICKSSWQPHKQQRDTAAATTTNKRTVQFILCSTQLANIVSIANRKKNRQNLLTLLKKDLFRFQMCHLKVQMSDYIILKSNKKKIIPRIFFDYVPKSSTFDTIFVRKNIPFLSLQRHSEIMQIFFFCTNTVWIKDLWCG